jgi:hypothetical protein
MRKYEILIQRESPPEPCKSFSLRMPMPFTHLSNVDRGKYFVNKSATLPFGQLNWSCNLIPVKQVIYFLDTNEKTWDPYSERISP